MDIQRLNEDMNIISVLPDEPNSVGGLSADELKARFDRAGNVLKDYINDSLVPDVEREIVAETGRVVVQSGNMPPGGAAGQILRKRSDTDFDWEFTMPPRPGAWELIQSYTTAGTYTWTAPNLHEDGRGYEIGVFIVGGGGSGAVGAVGAIGGVNEHQYLALSGGASGETRVLYSTVTPGQSIPLVVGQGGAGREILNIVAATGIAQDGNNGGASAFMGITIDSGQGGIGRRSGPGPGVNIAAPGASGGQGSDAVSAAVVEFPNTQVLENVRNIRQVAPARGVSTVPRYIHAGGTTVAQLAAIGLLPGGDTIPAMALNPFTGEYLLGAGGGAGTWQPVIGATGRSGWMQEGFAFGDGKRAGNGAAQWSAAVQDTIGGTATAVGSGGGSAASYAQVGRLARSGAGADGAVYIYVRQRI
ncbi:MAG: hypothetical protein FWC96_07465 [Oscillospiraceae bacterium]|nr:hypothetical protein [Oscillospiraceae bacterium]